MEHLLENLCLSSPRVSALSPRGLCHYLLLLVPPFFHCLLIRSVFFFFETYFVRIFFFFFWWWWWFSLIQIFTLLLFRGSWYLEASCVLSHFAFFPDLTKIILSIMRKFSELITLLLIMHLSLDFQLS